MSEKIALTVVVQGKPITIDAPLNAPLHSIIGRALAESGNVGQPASNWEFRDASGSLIDLDKTIEDLNFGPGTTVFLNLKAGVGG